MKIPYKITVFTAGLIFLMPLAASAEDSVKIHVSASTTATTTGPGGKIEMLREKAMQKREDLEGKIASTTLAKKEKIDATLKERFSKFVDMMDKRFDAAVTRFENIAGRIDTRIAKLDASGANTTDVKTLLVDAKAKIAVAKSDSALIKVDASATTTQDMYKAVKEEAEKAKVDLKAAQDSLSKTVEALMKIKVEIHPTSTATSTSN